MKAKILILLILVQITFSCKEEYCVKEIRKLTDIKLPENIEVIECHDNLGVSVCF